MHLSRFASGHPMNGATERYLTPVSNTALMQVPIPPAFSRGWAFPAILLLQYATKHALGFVGE